MMRVVVGEYWGCKLSVVLGMVMWLMIDKVKEVVFNIIGFYFDGGMLLDLYVGLGGFLIEGVLCGIEWVVLVDC